VSSIVLEKDRGSRIKIITDNLEDSISPRKNYNTNPSFLINLKENMILEDQTENNLNANENEMPKMKKNKSNSKIFIDNVENIQFNDDKKKKTTEFCNSNFEEIEEQNEVDEQDNINNINNNILPNSNNNELIIDEVNKESIQNLLNRHYSKSNMNIINMNVTDKINEEDAKNEDEEN
jgi:hypothetical protein